MLSVMLPSLCTMSSVVTWAVFSTDLFALEDAVAEARKKTRIKLCVSNYYLLPGFSSVRC